MQEQDRPKTDRRFNRAETSATPSHVPRFATVAKAIIHSANEDSAPNRAVEPGRLVSMVTRVSCFCNVYKASDRAQISLGKDIAELVE